MWKTLQQAIFVAVLIGVALWWGCREENDRIKPQLRQISESVYASVTVQPKQLYNVYPVHQGIIEVLHIAEGDSVEARQPLAEMLAVDQELNLQNANLRFKLAQDQYKGRATALASLREEIALMEVQVQVDSQNFKRQEHLWSQNIGSRSALENAELKYKASRKSLDVLRVQLDQKENELETAYEQARVAMEQARTTLDQFTVESRFDGCVYEVLKEEGERVLIQEAIARIGMCDSFILEMLVDEVDIARLRMGQLVIVHLDAYPKEVFEAAVTRIYPSKDLQTQTFTVEAEFLASPPVLYAGLGGEANIVIATRDNAMTIPIEYLKDDGWVVTPDGEKAIETGLRNLDHIEVLSGIDTSTVIMKPERK